MLTCQAKDIVVCSKDTIAQNNKQILVGCLKKLFVIFWCLCCLYFCLPNLSVLLLLCASDRGSSRSAKQIFVGGWWRSQALMNQPGLTSANKRG